MKYSVLDRRTFLLFGVILPVFVFPTSGPASPALCFEKQATIEGTAGDDQIRGTSGRDVIIAGDGDDVVYGLGEWDRICGGPGNDRLLGQHGADKISGQDGNDRLLGQQGVDRLYAHQGDDRISGGTGVDFLRGYAGNDELGGGPGNDLLGGNWWYVCVGEPVCEALYKHSGDDNLSGGRGDDWLVGSSGRDVYEGGVGIDLIDFFTVDGPGINLDLSQGTVKDGTFVSSVAGVENVTGSVRADRLIGDSAANRILGALYNDAGGDVIKGRGGNDYLIGTRLPDTIGGGSGNDYIPGCGGPGGCGDVLDGGDGIDVVDYVNYLSNLTSGVTVDLSAGTTSFPDQTGTDTLVSFEAVIGSGLKDVMVGDGGPNVLEGGLGNDQLEGADGNDELYGFYKIDGYFDHSPESDEESYGTPDTTSDQLDGGPGEDLLNGGPGTDACSNGEDVIGCE